MVLGMFYGAWIGIAIGLAVGLQLELHFLTSAAAANTRCRTMRQDAGMRCTRFSAGLCAHITCPDIPCHALRCCRCRHASSSLSLALPETM